VSAGRFLVTHSEQIVALASWTAVPAAYGYCDARRPDELWHGLSRFLTARRNLGRSHPEGRKADRSAVQRVKKVELCINQMTAKKLGIAVPMLLSTAFTRGSASRRGSRCRSCKDRLSI
jgi:hypothetical protein